MTRVDPELAEAFAKSAADEAFLEALNDRLAPAETYPPVPERFPTLHVVGAPRSGTTLATQLIARHLDVGYINNLIAAFWKAPVTGIRLSRKVLGDAAPASLTSAFGRTDHVEDPHEFGYFWRRLLQSPEYRELGGAQADAVDWDRLARVLTHMTIAYDRPVLFKSFQLAAVMDRVQAVLPSTCFVWVRRDPVATARSILKLRERFLGDRSRWASIKPRDVAELARRDVWEQVAGQALSLDRSIADAADRVGRRNVLELSYEALCRRPAEAVGAVRALLAGAGAEVAWRDRSRPAPLDHREPPDDADTERIREAVEALRPAYAPQ